MIGLLLYLLGFLAIIAGIVVLYWFVGKQFYAIAKMKGHPQKKYFWWCFWAGIIGWMMVIALPDRSDDVLPEL